MTEITAALVRRAMLEDLAASGIDEKSARKMKVRPLSPSACEELTGIKVAGYEIPYFDARGRVIKAASRVKFLTPVPGNEGQKYWQRADTIPRAYLPPLLTRRKWEAIFADPSQVLYITEGEKKAACACLNGVPCVGLGGVWSFKSKKAGIPLLKELEKISWRGRIVNVVFDSDVVQKPEVMRAMQALSSALRERGAASIRSVYLAENADEKVGLDDFIVRHGVEKFHALVAENSDPLLEQLGELNARYAVMRSVQRVYDMEQNIFISHAPFVRVNEAHRIVSVVDESGKPRRVRVAEAWLEWPNRREFDGLVFEPGKPRITENNEYNLWRGYPYQPRRGSVRPFLDLVESVFEKVGDDVRRWFLQWTAYPLANPGTKLASAVVVWGDQGTGKTFLGRIIRDLYGDHGRLLTQLNMDSGFNEWMVGAQFVLADEVVFHGDRRESNALKNIITRDLATVNQKYQPTYVVRDYANYYLTSNHSDALTLEKGDRRFLVVEAGSKRPRKFYADIDRWLREPDSYSHIMHYLTRQVDLSKFDPLGEPPFTEQKADMIHETMSSLDQVLDEALRSPDAFFQIGGSPVPRDLFTAEEVLALLPSEFRATSRNAVGRALRRLGCPKRGVNVRLPSGKYVFKRLYAVRDLERWRRAGAAEMSRHYATGILDPSDGKVVSIERARRRKFGSPS